MRSTRRPILLPRVAMVPALVAAAACTPAARPNPAPMGMPRVALVDSVAWQDELGEGTLRRVEVRAGTRVDTIPGVLAEAAPLILGGRLLGFESEGGSLARIYEYDVRTRDVRRHDLPRDLNGIFSAPAFSPDGRHVAYVVVPGDGTGFAVARTWPGQEVVWRSAPVEVPATDAAGGNAVRWLSPDVAEVFIESGHDTDSAWYRVRGSITRRAVVSADTVTQPPRFQAASAP